MARGLAQAIANRTHTEVTQSTHPSPKPSFALTEHTHSQTLPSTLGCPWPRDWMSKTLHPPHRPHGLRGHDP